MTDQQNNQEPGWERNVLEQLAFASLRDQRIARNWGIFFKLFFVCYCLVLLLSIIILIGTVASDGQTDRSTVSHTALIDLNGIIAPNTPASADLIVTGLRAAFKNKKTKGVIIRPNKTETVH